MPAPDGKIGHAELEIGNSMIMLSDEFPEMGGKSPTTIGGSPVTVMVFVEDVDSVFEKALDNGGTAISKVEDQFYGDRAGTFEDPWGHKWHVASHVEDVPPDEMERRAAAAMGG
jgi:PhnB protein